MTKNVPPSQEDLQAAFYNWMTSKNTPNIDSTYSRLETALKLEEHIKGSSTYPAHERMGAYHFAYHQRIKHSLEEDFPILKSLMGAQKFDILLDDYIQAMPSKCHDLGQYGYGVSEFLDYNSHSAQLIDVAKIEIALLKVREMRYQKPLIASALERLTPEDWMRVKFFPQSASLWLRVTPSAYKLFGAQTLEFQHTNLDKPQLSVEQQIELFIYRKEHKIKMMVIDAHFLNILKQIFDQKPLGKVFESLDSNVDLSQELIQKTFMDWMNEGFFVDFALDEPSV